MNNLLGLMQAAKNPHAFMQNLMNNSQINQNPIAKNALDMYQKGDKQGLNELAQNLCREKGTSYEEMTKQIMSQIGMN